MWKGAQSRSGWTVVSGQLPCITKMYLTEFYQYCRGMDHGEQRGEGSRSRGGVAGGDDVNGMVWGER